MIDVSLMVLCLHLVVFSFLSLSWFFNLVEFSIRTSKMFNVDEESIAQYSNIELLQVSGNIDKPIFFLLCL